MSFILFLHITGSPDRDPVFDRREPTSELKIEELLKDVSHLPSRGNPEIQKVTTHHERLRHLVLHLHLMETIQNPQGLLLLLLRRSYSTTPRIRVPEPDEPVNAVNTPSHSTQTRLRAVSEVNHVILYEVRNILYDIAIKPHIREESASHTRPRYIVSVVESLVIHGRAVLRDYRLSEIVAETSESDNQILLYVMLPVIREVVKNLAGMDEDITLRMVQRILLAAHESKDRTRKIPHTESTL
jgi:hypothetical protein